MLFSATLSDTSNCCTNRGAHCKNLQTLPERASERERERERGRGREREGGRERESVTVQLLRVDVAVLRVLQPDRSNINARLRFAATEAPLLSGASASFFCQHASAYVSIRQHTSAEALAPLQDLLSQQGSDACCKWIGATEINIWQKIALISPCRITCHDLCIGALKSNHTHPLSK